MRFRPLPHWVLTDAFPAFYDTESATAIEQTARLYKTMQELIKNYNAFVDEVNKEIADFECSTHKDMGAFKKKLTNMFYQFRRYIEDILQKQDMSIAEALASFETRFNEIEEQLWTSALNPETINAQLRATYDEDTEGLTIAIYVGEQETDLLKEYYYEDLEAVYFDMTVVREVANNGE